MPDTLIPLSSMAASSMPMEPTHGSAVVTGVWGKPKNPPAPSSRCRPTMAMSPTTAAIAVARELGVTDELIRKALATFGGVRRRFTRAGEWNGVTIIDDYGHHPVEISAVLRAARESTKGQVIAVVQPHRYTRLQSLFEPFSTCFNDADAVIVAEVYAAGEAPIEGVDRHHLVTPAPARGPRQGSGH